MQIAEQQRLILGAPGCGKTTRLLQILEEELASGADPLRIAYVSFTNQAVDEAVSRVTEKFGLTRDDLPYFRTLHSMCFRAQGLNASDVMKRAHYDELGQELGYNLSPQRLSPEDGYPISNDMGGRLMFALNLARNRCVDLEEQWHELNDSELDIFALRRLDAELTAYKREHALLDYTDMLENVVREQRLVNVDVVIIDEAQDLSVMQWDVCRTLFRNVSRCYIAGDDDQAIYRWAGADVETFLSLRGQQEVLGISHRLPREVYQVAQRIVGRIKNRFEKVWKPRDSTGCVSVLPTLDVVDYSEAGSWMILARNNYMLADAEVLLRSQGIPYVQRDGTRAVDYDHYLAIISWEKLRKGASVTGSEVKRIFGYLRPGTGVRRGYKGKADALDEAAYYMMEDLREHHGLAAQGIWHEALDGIGVATREYYITVLRSGRKLNTPPSVRIGSIHSVKGGEADNVVLLTDMSYRTFQGLQRFPDDEHRVFYVGATRAKKHLTIIQPDSLQAYPI